MTATFSYTGSVTFPNGISLTQVVHTDTPPPYFHVTGLTLASDINPGTNHLCVELVENSTGLYSTVTSVCSAPGGTTASTSIPGTVPAAAPSSRLRVYTDNVTTYPTTINVTITVTYSDAPTPVPCQYGVRPKTSSPIVIPIVGTLIDLVLNHFSRPELGVLFGSLVGSAMRIDTLCTTIPPVWPTIDIFSLLADDLQKLVLFQALAWHVLCECVPGTPPPVPFDQPTPVLPPDWPTYGPYPCTNSDICSTLLIILKRLDDLSQSQTHYSSSTTTIVAAPTTLAYTPGTIHSGLTGSGTISVSKLVGIRLELTAGIPGVELEGNPPYIWDVGWMSVSDGGAMLQERRITRSSAEWFPFEMQLASVWGYFFKGSEVGRMTELVPRAA